MKPNCGLSRRLWKQSVPFSRPSMSTTALRPYSLLPNAMSSCGPVKSILRLSPALSRSLYGSAPCLFVRLSEDGGVFTALSPARRRFLLLVVALAVATAAVVAAVVVRRATDTLDPVPQGSPGPVLVVPGYGGSLRSLDPLVARLREQGRDTSVVPLAGDGTGDLEVQAQVLADAAQAALARSGAESVDVVGYSTGGVVARLWVRDFGGAEIARRVLTIGSPHHGTNVAEVASEVVPGLCTGACEQLEPDSDLLRALNAGDETPDGPRFVSIWTSADELVTPPESAELDGALNIAVQDMCPASRVSHRGLPSDPVVLDTIVLELGVAPPAVPPRPDCSGS